MQRVKFNCGLIFPLKVNIGLIQTKDVPVTQNMFTATSNEVPPVYFQRTKRFDYLLFPTYLTLLSLTVSCAVRRKMAIFG